MLEEFTGSLLAGGNVNTNMLQCQALMTPGLGSQSSPSEVALHQMAYDYSIGMMTVLVREGEEEKKRAVVRTSKSSTFISHQL